jgi:hypothetical protein
MDIGAILLLLALLLAVGIYLFTPFLRRGARRSKPADRELSSLMAERDRVINALQELDFDHGLGKIPEEDYPAQRAELLQRGAGVLRQLDALAPGPSRAGGAGERLERAAAARRADGSAGAAPSDDEIESMLAARRKTRKERSAGFCPRCGKPILASDRFCPNCGKALT